MTDACKAAPASESRRAERTTWATSAPGKNIDTTELESCGSDSPPACLPYLGPLGGGGGVMDLRLSRNQ